MRLVLPLGLLCVSAAAAPAPVAETFRLLYDQDFTASLEQADLAIRQDPGNPMSHTARAAAWLFSELHRRKLLGKEFMTAEDRESKKPVNLPAEDARMEFHRAVGTAKSLAASRLGTNSSDREALLAMTISTGLERDYLALIEKKLRSSLEAARESQRYANRLLAVDPGGYDAYFTTGFNEYLVGSLPFFARWFMKMDGVEGNKQKGLQQLELAAEKGTYLGSFSRMMLALFYQREKRPLDTRRHLRQLAADHPRNAAVRQELEKIEGGQ